MSMPFSSVYSGGGSTYKREIVRNSVYEKPMNVPKLSCTTTNSPPFVFAVLSVVAKFLMFFLPISLNITHAGFILLGLSVPNVERGT